MVGLDFFILASIEKGFGWFFSIVFWLMVEFRKKIVHFGLKNKISFSVRAVHHVSAVGGEMQMYFN